jgi:hypothetical protein
MQTDPSKFTIKIIKHETLSKVHFNVSIQEHPTNLSGFAWLYINSYSYWWKDYRVYDGPLTHAATLRLSYEGKQRWGGPLPTVEKLRWPRSAGHVSKP